MLIFLDYLGQSSHLKETAMTRNVMNLTGSVTLPSAFFNRWLVVDVSPGWQLVSQVLLALHITLLRGGIIGSCWQRVLFCQGALFFSPHATSSTSAPACLLASHKRHLPPPFPPLLSSTTNTTFRFRLSLILSVFLSLPLSFWRAVPTQRAPITPPCGLSWTLTTRGAHTKRADVF